MTETKFVRYGDLLYLHSDESPKYYLSARSILEERVFFVQTPLLTSQYSTEKVDSTFYENQAELIFAIYPKLSYQAVKNHSKAQNE